MRNIIKKNSLLVVLILLTFNILAQPKVDNLKNKLKLSTDINNKIEICYQLDTLYQKILPDSAIKYANYGLSLIDEKHGINRKNDFLYVLGFCYLNHDKYKLSLNYLQQALEGYKKENNKYRILVVNNEIGRLYNRTSNFEKALSYYQQSLLIAFQLKDTLNICNILSNIGNMYQIIKDYKQALNNFEKVLKLTPKLNSNIIANTLNSISITYGEMQDYKMALKYGIDALNLYKIVNIKSKIALVCSNIGETYKRLNNIDMALKYTEEACQIIESAELQVKFDIKEKENENEILRQKTEIQQLAINKQTYLRNTFIYISIIFSLIVIFVIYRYRIKQNANKILTEKNELINKQKDELEEVYRTKDKLFAIITHDLKNPFNTIVSLSHFLESNYNNMSEDHKISCIQSLSKSVTNVSELLLNLTDWLNAKEDKLILHKANFNLSATIQSLKKLYLTQAEQKSIDLKINTGSDIYVLGNERLIKTVLRNLLDNAVKFTLEEGKIELNVKVEDNKIIVSVADTGVGIIDADKDKIFNLDTHITTKGTRSETGGGLGLILSKEFIEKNEGEIWFESEIGKGSTFYISLIKGDYNEEN